MNYDLNTKEGMANAVHWTQDLVDALSDNGTWIIPRSFTSVTLNKPTKTVTIRAVFPEPSVPKVFKAMGWTVIDMKGELQ